MSTGRLLCVYQHAPTPGAPGIYRHRLLFAELVRRGWQVDLVSTAINYMTGDRPRRYQRPYVREQIDGIDHHWVFATGDIHASKARRALNYGTFAAAAAARGSTLPRPDVILVSSPPLPLAAAGELLALRYRRPWVLEVRDIWPESAVSVGWLARESSLYRVLDRVARHAAQHADAVVVPTPGLVPGLLEHGAPGVDVIPGAVVDQPPDAELRAVTRGELGIAAEECLFVYVGAIGRANGVDTLVDAVAALPPEVRARVVLAGDGSDRRRLEARLVHEGLERVTFLGPVSKDGIAPLLAASDVCLHLLRPDPVFETAQPTKVLEYLGAHRAFITTVPGLPAKLATESGGAFASTVADLTAELRRWTELPVREREQQGEVAYAYGRERFGLQANADALEAVLDRVRR
jgi:colanic acid biosynthesis glycosyl transferase WcaI